MRARDLAYETVAALDSNRIRSLLTVLGIVIGIAAVIAMTALIGGVKMSMVKEMGLTQARLVDITYYSWPGIKDEDVEKMNDSLKRDYDFLTPVTSAYVEGVSSGKKKKDGYFLGVYPEYSEALGLTLTQGRFIRKNEVDHESQVVLLDQGSVKTLYGKPDEPVVGEKLTIKGGEYTIIGVVESGLSVDSGEELRLYVPATTLAKRLDRYAEINEVYGLAVEDSDMEQVAKHTKSWLLKYFKVDEGEEDIVEVRTMDSVIKQLDQTMMSFQVLMTSVASISLVVGGIGIMNMMLTNVTERIREIGLRKALGARRRDITRQFLLESVCLTLIGGAVGIVAGYFGSFALAGVAGDFFGTGEGVAITPYIDPQSVLFATVICVAIGIIFGYYPSHRAARLDPVESLRYQ